MALDALQLLWDIAKYANRGRAEGNEVTRNVFCTVPRAQEGTKNEYF